MIETFISPYEEELQQELLNNGFVIHNIEEIDTLNELRRHIIKLACSHLKMTFPKNCERFLNNLHQQVNADDINTLRMHIYNQMNRQTWLRPSYYTFGKKAITTLVGNELAMQNRVNLSIQMSGDSGSVLANHLDTFSGETPFQVVQWLPLVDVSDTKSMFILPPAKNREIIPRIKGLLTSDGNDAVMDVIKEHLVWPTLSFGQVMIFSPTLLHGNVVNETDETRWSLNCRFTGLFTPYTSNEKGLGSFYLPITTRMVSRIGMSYKPPNGFTGVNNG